MIRTFCAICHHFKLETIYTFPIHANTRNCAKGHDREQRGSILMAFELLARFLLQTKSVGSCVATKSVVSYVFFMIDRGLEHLGKHFGFNLAHTHQDGC